MYQTILILIWLFVIVAIFAAVGHAIWVILAGIFRWIVGQPRFVRSEPPRRVITGDPPVPPDVLLRRQLDRLHNRQLIGEATYQEVLRALDRYADEQQTSVAPHPPVVPLPPVPPRTVPPRPVPPRPVAPGAEPVRPVAAPPQDASPPRKAAPPTERARALHAATASRRLETRRSNWPSSSTFRGLLVRFRGVDSSRPFWKKRIFAGVNWLAVC